MTNLSSIENIYVIHAKKGYEKQEKRLITLFKKYRLDFEFVTDGDPSLFNDEIINKYFCSSIRSVLSDGILSCTLNHILCYEKIVERNNKFALIFENDPYFLGDFLDKMTKVMNEVHTLDKGLLVSLENSTLNFPSFKSIKKNKYLYKAEKGRCAGAYLIDLQGAKNILKDLESHKCCQVIDWWHNEMISRGIIKVFWAHPPLTEQGSHNGLMDSSISGSGKSLKRRIQWLAQKYYKTYIRILFK